MHAAQSHPAGRRWLILPLALGAVLVGCAPKAGVQAPLPVRGDTVRVTAGDYREVLTFQELQEGDLVLEGEGFVVNLPLDSIDGLETVVGHQRRSILGALVGLGVGAGFGALMGRGVFAECAPDDWLRISCLSDREARTVGAIIGGWVGAGVGILIGSSPTAVWAPVDASSLKVQAQASAGGLGLQLSWRP